MTNTQTQGRFEFTAPTVPTVDFYVALPKMLLPSRIVMNTLGTPIADKLVTANLYIDNVLNNEFITSGIPGSGMSGYNVNPTTPENVVTAQLGNAPYGINGVNMLGVYEIAVGADLANSQRNVVVGNVLIKSSQSAGVTSDYTNVISISAATTAVIQLTSTTYRDPYSQQIKNLVVGQTLYIAKSGSNTIATENAFDGSYLITAVDYATNSVTTNRNTTGFGTFVNSGSTICSVSTDPSGKIMSSNTNLVGYDINGYSSTRLIFRANTPILTAMANTVAIRYSVDLLKVNFG